MPVAPVWQKLSPLFYEDTPVREAMKAKQYKHN